jgi:hypothetical protein
MTRPGRPLAPPRAPAIWRGPAPRYLRPGRPPRAVSRALDRLLAPGGRIRGPGGGLSLLWPARQALRVVAHRLARRLAHHEETR